jgi:F-type H+-transporting ATPase subunit alpha
LQAFAQFSSDLEKETKDIIELGKRIMLMIKQPENSPLDQLQEIVFLYAIKYHYIK